MNFEYNDKTQQLIAQVREFMIVHVYPNEAEMFAQIDEGDRWAPYPLLEDLKAKAKDAGLWNLFLPESDLGAPGTSGLRRYAKHARRQRTCSAARSGRFYEEALTDRLAEY